MYVIANFQKGHMVSEIELPCINEIILLKKRELNPATTFCSPSPSNNFTYI